MHFGENQLSRSLIGLSPLPTGHPPSFQPRWVRSSTRSYPRFNLPMGRSLRFGSRARDYIRPIQTRFRYGSPTRVNLATHPDSQAHSSKGTPSPQQRRLRRIVSTRFQVLFHSPPGVLFTFPSRYLSAIGHQGVFRLNGWSRQIHTGFLEPHATRDNAKRVHQVSTTGLPPSLAGHSRPFAYSMNLSLPASRSEPARRLPQPRTCNT